MKTSQLIKELQDSLAQHGDVNVYYRDTEEEEGGCIDVEYVNPSYAWKAGQYGVVDIELQ